MNFRTRLDITDRQVKQLERTDVSLSGSSVFGLPFSALTTGPSESVSGVSETVINVISTFSGNTGTTVFTFGDSRMDIASSSISALTSSNSATTQDTGNVWTGNTSQVVDGNFSYLDYTGVSFNLEVTAITEVSLGVFTGTCVSDDVFILSADTLDFTGRTIWVDNPEITRTNKLIVSDGAISGYVLKSDSEGMATWQPSSAISADTNTYTTGTTLVGSDLYFDTNAILSAYTADLSSFGGAFVHAASGQITPTNAYANSVTSNYSSVLGGKDNTISGTTTYSTIAGGQTNEISDSARWSFIGAGKGNDINGFGYSSINSGRNNFISHGGYSTIGGGKGNQITVSNVFSTSIGGGQYNRASAAFSTIGGGNYNKLGGGLQPSSPTDGRYSFIGGGKSNKLYNTLSVIAGGELNQIGSPSDAVTLEHNTIGGGNSNTIGSYSYNTIAGGESNTITTGGGSTIGGGNGNKVYTWGSTIAGGQSNIIHYSSYYSFIGGGDSNVIQTGFTYSSIVGGQSNVVNHSGAHIIGSNITSFTANTTHVEKLNVKTLNGTTAITSLAVDANGMVVDGSSLGGFTGNTSGDCITDLYVSNIHSCSPLNINPLDEGNVYVGSNSGFTLDLTNTRLGLNNATPQELLHAKDGDFLIEHTSGTYLSDFDNATGGLILLSGLTTGVPRFGVKTPTADSITMGVRGINNVGGSGYGKPGDGFIYSSIANNGINIISQPGTGTDDYIRFFAGQAGGAAGTPDLYIQGTGATKGYVAFGHDTPTERVDILGSIKMVDGNEANGYVMTSDVNGVATWQPSSGGTTSPWTAGTGTNSAVLGNTTNIASGTTSVAEGSGTIAGGSNSHAEGLTTTASGTKGSHAEGQSTIASGTSAHAEGSATIAGGDFSHAEGNGTTASGAQSHAEGQGTIASGIQSHAEGLTTTASGSQSHAGGVSSIASGATSFIHSTNSSVTADRSVVLGGQNITGDTADMVYVPDLVIDGLTSTDPLATDADGKIIAGASDARLKTNIKELESALDKVLTLRGVSYEWTEESNMGADVTKYGLIAQEVREVIPEMVKLRSKGDGMLTLSYTEIIPWLIEAIKELSSGTTFTRNEMVLETQTIASEDNNIELNYNGNHDTAVGGGVKVLDAINDGVHSEIKTDKNGGWSITPSLSTPSLIVPEYTPTSTSDESGSKGDTVWDDDYIYIKTNTGWKRSSLENF